MCGRFATDFDPYDVAAGFDAQPDANIPSRSWNVTPTNDVMVLAKDDGGGRHASPARWSLTPPWAESLELSYPTHNARVETVLEKRTFRDAALRRRVLIPASGYYEWDSERRPWYFHDPGQPVLYFAGLASWWRGDPKARFWRLTCTILTRRAVGDAEQVHARMPLLIGPDHLDAWTDPTDDAARLLAGAAKAGIGRSERLEAWRVMPLRGDGPELARPFDGE